MNNIVSSVIQIQEDLFMQDSVRVMHSINWNYVSLTIARLIKKSLLSDDEVKDSVKNYLQKISKEQLDFYFLYRINCDLSLYSSVEGRSVLNQYQKILKDSHEDLFRAGFNREDINFYETIAFLSDERSQIVSLVSVEELLVHNKQNGFFDYLIKICEKYNHSLELTQLNKLCVQIDSYKESYEQTFVTSKASSQVPWYMRLIKSFS